jgi:hypothetical protein
MWSVRYTYVLRSSLDDAQWGGRGNSLTIFADLTSNRQQREPDPESC